MDPTNLIPLPPGLAATVASLHRVAEELAAPARKPDNEIALVATPGGFGTPEFEFEGSRRQVRVEGTELVHSAGEEERRAALTTLAEGASVLTDLLPPGSSPSPEPLAIDPTAARALAAWYQLGAAALDRLVSLAAPGDEATPPRLWPEHFDIAIELGGEAEGARANYGFSPGDENHPEPYAYVGPWSAEVSGDLWRATGFNGAELGYAELLAAPDPLELALDFLTTRWDLLVRMARSAE
ncbi:MAG: hypothetical protein U0R26_07130 [Solirubrobacterales bacterium]